MDIDIHKQKIDTLFQRLTKEGYDHFESLIKELKIDANTLIPFANWAEDKYQRVCLAHDEHSELMLLCWAAGQGTPIHNHGKQKCWVHIIDGKITETLYEPNNVKNILNKRTISGGAFTYLTDDIGLHKLENSTKNPTISLHLYANPIKTCDVYDSEKEVFFERTMSYDKVL